MKCSRTNCDIGILDNSGNCSFSCNRTNSIKLNCSINKYKEDHFLCKQSYFSFLYELDQLKKQQSESRCDNVIISDRDNRKIILAWIFNTNIQIIEELLNIYDKLQECEIKSWNRYT